MSLLDNIIGTKIVSGLLDRRRPLVDANPLQGFYDSAPAGSVMAPGGLLANPMSTPIGSTPGATQDMLGLLSFAPIVGDAAGLAADAQMYANQPETRTLGNYAMSALGALPFVPSVAGATVFHGSPHKFDAFDMSKIGTGEGAQAYGHGLYFAESPGVAGGYKNAGWGGYVIDEEVVTPSMSQGGAKELAAAALSRFDDKDEAIKWIGSEFPVNGDEAKKIIRGAKTWGKNLGHFYTVDLPDEHIAKMLDWDAPLSEQPESVIAALEKAGIYDRAAGDITGDELHQRLFHQARKELGTNLGAPKYQAAVAEKLKQAGIPGVKYFDGGSRAAGEGTRNYVVFDDQLPTILRRE